jgi:hypothetical protein
VVGERIAIVGAEPVKRAFGGLGGFVPAAQPLLVSPEMHAT